MQRADRWLRLKLLLVTFFFQYIISTFELWGYHLYKLYVKIHQYLVLLLLTTTTYLSIYLSTYLPTYLPTSAITYYYYFYYYYLSTYLPTYLPLL